MPRRSPRGCSTASAASSVGDPMDPATDIGPLISEEARKVERRSRRRSPRAPPCAGRRRIQPEGLRGPLLEPTVLTGVRHGSLPTTEEVFGPVLAVTVARDADEAIAMANDSKYGLGASIYRQPGDRDAGDGEHQGGHLLVNDPLTDNDAGPSGYAPERDRPRAGRGGAGRLPRAQARAPRLRHGAEVLLVSLPEPPLPPGH